MGTDDDQKSWLLERTTHETTLLVHLNFSYNFVLGIYTVLFDKQMYDGGKKRIAIK